LPEVLSSHPLLPPARHGRWSLGRSFGLSIPLMAIPSTAASATAQLQLHARPDESKGGSAGDHYDSLGQMRAVLSSTILQYAPYIHTRRPNLPGPSPREQNSGERGEKIQAILD
jgi:hypothetical protein